MTLLTICNKLAENVGLQETTAVISSAKREWVEAVAMSNMVGDELARRVDFGAMRNSATLTGDGTNKTFDLGSDFSRIIPGIGVTYGSGIIRPLTGAEWASLYPVAGSPRYFMLEGRNITLWPYLGDELTVAVRYQSRNWCANNSNTWAADSDESLIDENLMIKGLIVRWRRQKGMDYLDYEAEYEADLADIARFDDRSRL